MNRQPFLYPITEGLRLTRRTLGPVFVSLLRCRCLVGGSLLE
jgi:hypothetical protein